MLLEQPYFMINEEWYYHDKKKNKYFLTDKAPKKAVESYNEFYNKLNQPDMVFMNDILLEVENDIINDLKKEGKTQEEIDSAVAEWKKRISN